MIHLGQRERMIKYMIKNLFTCLLCLCVLVGCDNSEDKVSHNYSYIRMYKPFSPEYGVNFYKDDANAISDIIFDGYHEVSEDEYNANDTVELIMDKYQVTREELENYNDLSNLSIGSKIIVPTHAHE